jgi:hypothetical protein
MATVLRAKCTWVQAFLVPLPPLRYKKEKQVTDAGLQCFCDRIMGFSRSATIVGSGQGKQHCMDAGISIFYAGLRRTILMAQERIKRLGSRLCNLPETSGGMLYAV